MTIRMYQTLCSWDNLLLAYRKASRGKRGHPSVAAFEHRLESNLLELRNDLLNFRYAPGRYRSFFVHEPKRRLISAAAFQDRVVHHALCNVIETVFEKSFIRDSFANRKGKGTHRALDRCQQFCRRYRFVLQCDVEQFFASIDHEILLSVVRGKIDEPDVLRLIGLILKGGRDALKDDYKSVIFPGDDLFSAARDRGLPIGNLTSQFLANVYLNPFDHFVKRELGCKAYIRYVDDFLLFGDEKETLWTWAEAVEKRLERYRLTLHRGVHPVPVKEGAPFLGFIIFPDRRRLKRRKGIHFQRKLKKMKIQYQAGEIDLETVQSRIRGWINHVRYGNTIGLRKAIFSKHVFVKG
jgi:RNA-directed DNA polymerase